MTAVLRDIVRAQALRFPDAGPAELAKQVVACIDSSDVYGFLEEALRPYVADMLRQSRNDMLNGIGPSRSTSARSGSNPSPKLRDIRDGFRRLCAERVHVGNAEWKTVGECGTADLAFCIAEREEHISKVRGQIANYQLLADLLEQHGVSRVADLPPQVVFP